MQDLLPQTTVGRTEGTSQGQTSVDYDAPRKAKKTIQDMPTTGMKVLGMKVLDFSTVGLDGGSDTLADYDGAILASISTKRWKTLHQRTREDQSVEDTKDDSTNPRMMSAFEQHNNHFVTTYTGNFDFYDNQTQFDITFPNISTISGALVTDESIIKTFIDLCMYKAFLQLVRMDYVGT